MREIIKQIRYIIAEKLLNLYLSIIPDGERKNRMCEWIVDMGIQGIWD